MYEEYIKEDKIYDKTEKEIDMELVKSIIKTKMEIEVANKNFEFAEAELIDYYTYQIKANHAKLNYLLKKVKKRGIILDMINERDLRLDRKNEVI